MNKLQQIYLAIKEVKIQGATNIAKAALNAYFIEPTEKNKRKLMSLRPTEPMLMNVLNLINKLPKEKILNHFSDAQNKINKNVFKLIGQNKIIFTHCHSTNVVKALIYAKQHRKKFEVYNTETRPLYQGRITAAELVKAGIKVTTFIDSGMHEAIKNSSIALLGADALLKNYAINKIGSDAIAEIASVHKKPLYIVADSWKFSPKNVKIEERGFHEVWSNAPKKVRIENPAFEKIEKKYIAAVISEYGKLKYNDFIKKAAKIRL